MLTTNYQNNFNVDFNALFDTYSSGSQVAPTGYQDASGNDLSTLFAPYTGGTKANNTGYQDASGNDLSNLFAKAPPSFPTINSTNINYTIQCDMVGNNVVCGSQTYGEDRDTFIYYSNNSGVTLTKAFGGAVMVTNAIAMSGTNVIAVASPVKNGDAASYNYYTSTNSGNTYTQRANAGITTINQYFSQLGQIGFVGQYAAHGKWDSTISYSSNYGVTWATATGAPSVQWSSVKLYGNGSIGVACNASGTSSGIYYSSNYGATWTLSNYTATRAWSSAMTSNGYIFACVGDSYGNHAVVRSINNGATWTTTNLSAGITFNGVATRGIKCIIAGENFVFAGEDDSNANYYSKDYGVTWNVLVTGAIKPATGAITNNGKNILVGGENNLYYGRNVF